MFIVREVFHLKFGHYRDAKALVDEAVSKKMFSRIEQRRLLTDFTGTSYRMIFETTFEKLDDFEKEITEMSGGNWFEWFHRFKQHVESSSREILKLIDLYQPNEKSGSGK